jgi:hypothetical protein
VRCWASKPSKGGGRASARQQALKNSRLPGRSSEPPPRQKPTESHVEPSRTQATSALALCRQKHHPKPDILKSRPEIGACLAHRVGQIC